MFGLVRNSLSVSSGRPSTSLSAQVSRRSQLSVWRMDTHGAVFRVRDSIPAKEALELAQHLESLGHKQTYWTGPPSSSAPPSSSSLSPFSSPYGERKRSREQE